MSVTREELAAFADGELGEPRRSQVAAEVAQDEALAADVERHRALKAQLSAHFAPILEQPVPYRLADLLGGRDTTVVDLATARQRREGRLRIPRWGWIAGPALAASVALAVLLPGRGTPEGYAAPQIAAVLDERLVAEQEPGQEIRVLLSFRDEAGAYCRVFQLRRRAASPAVMTRAGGYASKAADQLGKTAHTGRPVPQSPKCWNGPSRLPRERPWTRNRSVMHVTGAGASSFT